MHASIMFYEVPIEKILENKKRFHDIYQDQNSNKEYYLVAKFDIVTDITWFSCESEKKIKGVELCKKQN